MISFLHFCIKLKFYRYIFKEVLFIVKCKNHNIKKLFIIK